MEVKFYRCNVCGNIVCKVEDSGLPMTCCGKQMTELKPESTDGAKEKHVPMYEIIKDHVFVQVGVEEHPMLDYHHVEFIGIETNLGIQIKYLMPEKAYDFYDKEACCKSENLCESDCMTPRASFRLNEGEKLISIFEYCNLHGMFRADI